MSRHATSLLAATIAVAVACAPLGTDSFTSGKSVSDCYNSLTGVTPTNDTIPVGGTTHIVGLYGSSCEALGFEETSWSSSNPTIASVPEGPAESEVVTGIAQ